MISNYYRLSSAVTLALLCGNGLLADTLGIQVAMDSNVENGFTNGESQNKSSTQLGQ